MSFNLEKLIQNIELKLRGRGALVAAILIVLTVMFWLVLHDYGQHPIFSQIFCYAILAIILLIIIMAQFGKAQPDEVPEKTVVQIGRVGMFFAKGLSSKEEMMAVLRQWNGLEKLPPPSSRVRGSAAQEKNYEDFSATEADEFVKQVEETIQATLTSEAQAGFSQLQKELAASSSSPQSEDKPGTAQGAVAGVLRSSEQQIRK
jgi:hypothetical protein